MWHECHVNQSFPRTSLTKLYKHHHGLQQQCEQHLEISDLNMLLAKLINVNHKAILPVQVKWDISAKHLGIHVAPLTQGGEQRPFFTLSKL